MSEYHLIVPFEGRGALSIREGVHFSLGNDSYNGPVDSFPSFIYYSRTVPLGGMGFSFDP